MPSERKWTSTSLLSPTATSVARVALINSPGPTINILRLSLHTPSLTNAACPNPPYSEVLDQLTRAPTLTQALNPLQAAISRCNLLLIPHPCPPVHHIIIEALVPALCET